MLGKHTMMSSRVDENRAKADRANALDLGGGDDSDGDRLRKREEHQ